MRRRGTVVYLVQPRSTEQIEETKARLAELLADEDLIGLAYVAWRRGGFGYDAVGEARRQPLLTRTMVLFLDEDLKLTILGEK